MGVNVVFIIAWIPKHIGFFFIFGMEWLGYWGRRQGKGIEDKKSCIRFSVFYYFNYDAN